MSTQDLDWAVGRLEGLLGKSTDKLDQALHEFDGKGFSKVTLINHPMQKRSGRTLVHLAAGNNLNSCLELLLKYKGRPFSPFSPILLQSYSPILAWQDSHWVILFHGFFWLKMTRHVCVAGHYFFLLHWQVVSASRDNWGCETLAATHTTIDFNGAAVTAETTWPI